MTTTQGTPPTISAALANFDNLPDNARASLSTVCALYAVSPATIWRRVRSGTVPAPIKDGASTRWLVGELKTALARTA